MKHGTHVSDGNSNLEVSDSKDIAGLLARLKTIVLLTVMLLGKGRDFVNTSGAAGGGTIPGYLSVFCK